MHLELTSLGTNYQLRATRIVRDFRNPVDSAIVGNKLYVLENGGNQGLWEITFPAAPVPLLSGPSWLANGKFQFTLERLRRLLDVARIISAHAEDVLRRVTDWRVTMNVLQADASAYRIAAAQE